MKTKTIKGWAPEKETESKTMKVIVDDLAFYRTKNDCTDGEYYYNNGSEAESKRAIVTITVEHLK